MKKTFTLPALFLLLFLGFSACDTQESDELSSEILLSKVSTDELAGEWEWKKTYSGWTGWETPSSKGYTETVSLGKNNVFKRFRDGAVVEERTYYLTKEKSSSPTQEATLYLHLVDNSKGRVSSQPVYPIGTDTIKIIPQGFVGTCDDCPTQYYVRKTAAPKK